MPAIVFQLATHVLYRPFGEEAIGGSMAEKRFGAADYPERKGQVKLSWQVFRLMVSARRAGPSGQVRCPRGWTTCSLVAAWTCHNLGEWHQGDDAPASARSWESPPGVPGSLRFCERRCPWIDPVSVEAGAERGGMASLHCQAIRPPFCSRGLPETFPAGEALLSGPHRPVMRWFLL